VLAVRITLGHSVFAGGVSDLRTDRRLLFPAKPLARLHVPRGDQLLAGGGTARPRSTNLARLLQQVPRIPVTQRPQWWRRERSLLRSGLEHHASICVGRAVSNAACDHSGAGTLAS
jgi:hypothetical protein